MVYLGDDFFASIDNSDKILKIGAGVEVAFSPVLKGYIFGREKSDRRDEFKAGVCKLLLRCSRQRLLEPGCV